MDQLSGMMDSCLRFEVKIHTSPGPNCGTFNHLWLNLIGSQGETPPVCMNEHLLPGSVCSVLLYFTHYIIMSCLSVLQMMIYMRMFCPKPIFTNAFHIILGGFSAAQFYYIFLIFLYNVLFLRFMYLPCKLRSTMVDVKGLSK